MPNRCAALGLLRALDFGRSPEEIDMKYDKQVIISILSDPVKEIRNMGRNLYNLNPTKSIWLEVTNGVGVVIQDGDRNLTANSRLYLVGHGTLQGTTLGGMTGEQVADALVGLNFNTIGKISLVSCFAAGLFTELPQLQHFATQLHGHLGQKYSIHSVLTARRTLITVTQQGKKITHPNPNGASLGSPYISKRPQSKIEIFWTPTGEQQWRYAY